jgi:hypothetical protein
MLGAEASSTFAYRPHPPFSRPLFSPIPISLQMFKKRTRPASVREKTDAPSLPNPDDLPVAAAATEEAGPSAVAESSTASGSTAAAAVDEDEPQVGCVSRFLTL